MNFIGGHVSLLVPRRKLRCLVYLCPIGKTCHLCRFLNSWFKDGFAKTSCFNMCHKNVGKETAVFVLIAVPWVCTDSALH